jgi:hypothetical protein
MTWSNALLAGNEEAMKSNVQPDIKQKGPEYIFSLLHGIGKLSWVLFI